MNVVQHDAAPRSWGRVGLLLALAILAGGLAFAAFAGLTSTQAQRVGAATAHAATAAPSSSGASASPQLVVTAPRGHASSSWRVVASVGGTPAAWLSQRPGLTLMRFAQGLVHLNLHAGKHDGGARGWTFGNTITAAEAQKLVAAFNGGFKLTYKETGFMANGHVARPLRTGLASIVTYADGTTNIGAWHQGVPTGSSPVFSVLQNQRLLVDHGVATPNVSSCIIKCWGGTIGLKTEVARSALGITSSGQLVWAAGEHLSPQVLASALMQAGAQRAIELDINPWWVAGYVYVHGRHKPKPVPLVSGQRGIEGAMLKPYARDFLAIVAN